MKVNSVLISLSLGILGSLWAGNLSQNLESNTQSVFAQTVPSSCPLPTDIAVTFLNTECKEVKLEKPQIFYRYFGGKAGQIGRYLTTDLYRTNVDAIQRLALNQDWGNPADTRAKVTLPAGTVVYQGIAAPQAPSTCYPGGGQQTFIKDPPSLGWEEPQSMFVVVKPLPCPVP